MGKGADWERDLCKYLSKWIQGTEKPYCFWRGRGSGATFTSDNLVGESFAGDLYPVREEGKFLTDNFVVEAKNGYPTTSIDKHLKYGKDDKLLFFWQQVIEDSTRTEKYPLLVYKKKGQSPWIGIDFKIYNTFIWYIKDLRHVCIHWDIKHNTKDLYLLDFKEFFDIITPGIMKKELPLRQEIIEIEDL